MPNSITPSVAEKLGFYVYMYVDPRTDEPFYVGKGQGQRALAHLADTRESHKVLRINEIRAENLEPRIDILIHGLQSEEAALRLESAVIDAIGPRKLVNAVRGHGSSKVGRMPLAELEALYGAAPVQVRDPALLIRVNRLYRFGMSELELYEATRGIWKLGPRRERGRYAFAVYHGVVRAVYEIKSWHHERTTLYQVREFPDPTPRPGRWEFVGKPAVEKITAHFIKP